MSQLTVSTAENRLKIFDKNFDDMERVANELMVDSPETLTLANEMIAKAKTLEKSIEAVRVGVYDELYPKGNREIVKAANDLAKKYKKRLAIIIQSLERNYMDYRRAKEEAERKKALEAERAAEEARKAFIPPDLLTQPDLSKQIPQTTAAKREAGITRSDSGSSYTRKEKSYKVVDFSMVPDSYKTLDVQAVRSMMNAKNRDDIPGIEWIEIDRLVTRVS